jgi:DNA polymerase-3 subunit beta
LKLTIERSDALRALSLVAGIAARKSTIPILANVMLETDDAGLRVVASDMSIEISTRLPAKVEEGGATTVSADRLLEIVKALPEGADMTMTTSDDDVRMVVKSGRSRFLLPQLDAAEFPRLSDELGEAFTVPAGDLIAIIDGSEFMGDADDSRPFVQSLYIHAVGGSLRSVGASRNGIAYHDVDLPDDAVGFSGGMLDLEHAAKVRGLIGGLKPDEAVKVSRPPGQFSFNIGGSILKCVDVKGDPVDYPPILARCTPDREMVADVDLLTGAVRRALVMQTEKVRVLRLSCVDGALSITGRNMQTGESSDLIDVDVDGDFELAFNGVRLLSILGQIKTESVVCKFHATQPQLMTVSATGETRSMIGLMPMYL